MGQWKVTPFGAETMQVRVLFPGPLQPTERVVTIKVFGEHDEKTVQQLWRCMAVGSVYKGVLCADGHYGYAQPVGGVVAYEKHISVSGVGFDIGCGNMAVRLDLSYDDIKARI